MSYGQEMNPAYRYSRAVGPTWDRDNAGIDTRTSSCDRYSTTVIDCLSTVLNDLLFTA